MIDVAFCCNSHSSEILNANLARSPCLSQSERHVETTAVSAGRGYNRAIDRTDAPILVFAHHDVYLPLGWDRLLAARLAEIEARDPNWALFGAFGVGLDTVGWGPVWSSSLGHIVGRVPSEPVPAQSFDEMLIVLRRESGLRFDEDLPGWHMYGTDIVQTASSRGMGAYAGGLPCIHNDGFHAALGTDFDDCYRFMHKKWHARLPIWSTVMPIRKGGLTLMRARWKMRRSHGFRESLSLQTTTAPEVLAAMCGWSDLSASADRIRQVPQDRAGLG